MTYTGHRTERFYLELLTKNEQSLGYLDGFEGGDLAWNANADLPGGGSVLLEDLGQDINYSRDRVKVWQQIDDLAPIPWGVFCIAAPTKAYRADGGSRQVTLLDKVTVLRDDVLTSTLQIPAGTNVVQAMVAQVQAAGETAIAFTPSSTTLTNDMTFNPGISRHKVISELATVAGYWSAWTDRNGQFRIEPYRSPADRPESYRFEQGETSIHSPNWEYELDLWSATNTVVFVSQAEDDEVPFSAYAVDDNPDSPTSTVSMGRVLNPIVEENVEANSQATLQLMANRKLIDNSNVVGKMRVSHRSIPVWYNEAVRFKSDGIDTKATITTMSLPLIPGSLIQAEWRQA